jgi:glutathione synthase/RimK-type ligase-like ATP-grasp enzyme
VIPFIKESVKLCINAHRLLYFNFIIGWDVAITDEGPMIVEANEKPGLNIAQCIDGGLGEKIIKHALQILNS